MYKRNTVKLQNKCSCLRNGCKYTGKPIKSATTCVEGEMTDRDIKINIMRHKR
jgi:hypothetical protein